MLVIFIRKYHFQWIVLHVKHVEISFGHCAAGYVSRIPSEGLVPLLASSPPVCKI